MITYSTRALKEQLVRYISKFYADKNGGELYDSNKIRIMQAWGSASAIGVYYDVCKHHGIAPLNFTQAKIKYGKNRAFSKACEEVLKAVPEMDKMYDCILIDEAQDFDKSFLSLCLKVLGDEKRLVYAYDELQQLNEETMPTPKEIFEEEIQNDTPLTVCYRNQSPVIVTAHAIGMGMYREDSIVYTNIFRAKGNETFMVYIVNAQRCINSLVPRSDRNALFTAITRSKGWIKVMGYGEEMQSLCKEFEQVKKNGFKLHFDRYPSEIEREQMVLNNSDLDEQTLKSIQDARSKIAKAKATGKSMSNIQLMMEIMGVSTKEELMKMLLEDE